jgi:hypothetical protein
MRDFKITFARATKDARCEDKERRCVYDRRPRLADDRSGAIPQLPNSARIGC